MKKRIATILLSALFVIPALVGAAACDDSEVPDPNKNKTGRSYDIVVWVGERTDVLTKKMIEEFNKTNEWNVTFNATVEVASESRAAGDALASKETAADIFCFAQDQLARLANGEVLTTLNSASVEAIEKSNDEGTIKAATIGNTIRAFPLTADNGFFMYYDKRVVKEEHVGSLEEILEDCANYEENGEKKQRNFSMNLTEDGGGWYAASFLYATGCVSEWVTDESGRFIDKHDTFNSQEGIIALKGMQKLLQSPCYRPTAEVSDFLAGVPSGVVISGIWGYKAAQEALGENLGIAPLPSFSVYGKDYRMVSYLGHKFMGVKEQSDPYKSVYLQKLAMYLTNEENQLARFREVGWGPADTNAKKNADVLASPALKALADTKTVLQEQYPTNWWSNVVIMTGSTKTSSSNNDDLGRILSNYDDSLPKLLSAAE